jgi:diguanylate cyclase (GGDEF)-like protein/PAS domain S-box-containing protein
MSSAVSRALILVVEDDYGIADLETEMIEAIEKVDCRVLHAASGQAVLEILATQAPTLMLLDYSLPDMTAIVLLERIASSGLSTPPFIVTTGAGDEQVAVELMRRGAQNYLIKDHAFLNALPGAIERALHELEVARRLVEAESELRIAAIAFESQEGMFVTDANYVILRVNRAFTRISGYSAEDVLGQKPHLLGSGRHDAAFFAAMKESLATTDVWQGEIWNRRKNGEIYLEWLTITSVRDEHGKLSNYVATLSDITFRKQAEDEIKYLAFYDPLTQLPNRRLMLDRLQHALDNSQRHGSYGALILLDLDNFKTLNDTLGHEAGDQLLLEVASRLQACLREGDTAARLGGDEFVVILENLEQENAAAIHAEYVATKIQSQLAQPYALVIRDNAGPTQQRMHQCTSSLGITLFRDASFPVDELLRRADTAMYQAKAAGRDTLCFFDHEMQIAVARRAQMEEDLRKAVVEQQFILHYQAQVDSSGQIIGAEALLRWQHPERGLVSPADFIPLAEETGLILPLGFWVLQTACRQLAAWAKIPALADLTLAVNVSARQFTFPQLEEEILSLIDGIGTPPARLKLELTESVLLKNAENVIDKMMSLKARGIGFSLDDFGTGYSSLSYLKRLPLDQLKIDQSFVRDILSDNNDAVIAQTIIALAQNLGLNVIAEGVEIAAQRDFLAGAGCHAYQGYFFSRPLPIEGFEAFVQQSERLSSLVACQPLE